MVRQRDPEHIRRDAITMAVKKAGEGCMTCGEHYFQVARQYGASDKEIERVIAHAPALNRNGISRRDLLKLAAASVGGLVLAGGNLPVKSVDASYSYWWGTDTGTMRQSGAPPQQFYIGKFGSGTNAYSGVYFNTSAASLAGYGYTYGFWDIEGAGSNGSKPSGQSAYQWGQNQATAAVNSYLSGPNSNLMGASTIFGDFETVNNGYVGTSQSSNQQVLEGWLYQVYYLGASNGIYTGMGAWNTLVGSGFRPKHNFALWVTGCQTGSLSGNPCNNSSSTTETNVQNVYSSTIYREIVGGSQVVLWQYWISDVGCGDYDVTTYTNRRYS